MTDFDKNSYETPQWLFDEYNREFKFRGDLAATADNTKCENFFDVEKNSLEQKWFNLTEGWLWLNPPYKPLKPWIEKAQQEATKGAKIVALVPLPTITTNYFLPQLCYRIDVIRGRISFEREGVPHHGNDSTHCLLFWNVKRLASSQLNFLDAKKTEMEWLLS